MPFLQSLRASSRDNSAYDKVLYDGGVRDFERYRVDATAMLMSDFFVPDDDVPPPGVAVRPLPSDGGAPKSG
jgi:citronellol/citronellal dehydrogenase